MAPSLGGEAVGRADSDLLRLTSGRLCSVNTPCVDECGRYPEDAPEAEVQAAAEREAAGVLRAFCLFSAVFSLNHGTVTASIPLATGDFGEKLGSYSLGTLYTLYTLAAMLVVAPLLDRMETRGCLMLGLGLNTVYVASYLVGRETDGAARWAVVLFGAAIGGVAAGIIWPAQGAHFARCAERYSGLRGEDSRIGTAKLGGLFAAIYLAIEVLCKLLSSLTQVVVCGERWEGDIITGHCGSSSSTPAYFDAPGDGSSSGSDDDSSGRAAVFALFLSLASLTTGLMGCVPLNATDAPTPKAGPQFGGSWSKRAQSAFTLMLRDPKVILMAGVNLTFGASVAFTNSYVTGTVVKDSVGTDKVGFLDAIIPLVAALLSIPLARASSALGTKAPAIIFGLACMMAATGVFAVVHDPVESLGKWSVLPVIFVVNGAGRAMWEGPNKAVFADYFMGADAEAGFSNLIFQFGASAAATFYAFPSMGFRAKGYLCAALAALSMVAYLASDCIYRRERGELVLRHPPIQTDSLLGGSRRQSTV
eukprot:TRINITY_DN4319_c0_g1_i1.p1 TRINITY_DN4319_c0_g1~~TRINITY_DN4319_c0_g1_i1.p1  ORF type:complete len:556 (+),score=155.17 TRINITY_DN4319_c0_g1_i1:69-1670(+)